MTALVDSSRPTTKASLRHLISFPERHRTWSLIATALLLLAAGAALGGGVGMAATHVISLALDHVSATP
ncbi:hypothetical protein BH11ACT8_BH11ACT8_03750 [soil metagenome]